MKAMIKDAIILLIITLFAGLALGYVYNITKEPIAITMQQAKENAYKMVYKDATSFEQKTDCVDAETLDGFLDEFKGVTIEEVMLANDSENNTLGYVLTVTTNEGYGGNITFTIGITSGGTVNGISILNISETAGLGMRAEEVLQPQFSNKTVDSFTVTKMGSTSDSQIDAISGATITSNAITKAVNGALYYFKNTLGGVINEE